MPFKRVMPVLRGVTQSRWDYVNVRGFGALTVAPALRLPGVYGPWGRWGTNQQESVAGLPGHSLLTLFPLIARSAGAERPQVSDRSALCGGKSLAVELP